MYKIYETCLVWARPTHFCRVNDPKFSTDFANDVRNCRPAEKVQGGRSLPEEGQTTMKHGGSALERSLVQTSKASKMLFSVDDARTHAHTKGSFMKHQRF